MPLFAAFLVHPFVQSVLPDSAWVVWESDAAADAEVVWSWDDQTLTTPAVTAWGDAASAVREAQLTGLQPGTFVSYEVHDGGVVSGPYTFRTAQDPATAASVRLVAVSDMQRSDADPTKWGEAVHDGMIAWLDDAHPGDLAAALDGVLIAGDLVDNGNVHDDWTRDFFGQSHPLGAQVPLLPVLGNHEDDSPWYFRYFHLPDNGAEAGAEHWWSHRLANVRLLGLDSNGAWIAGEQLTWLDDQLAAACDEPGVDFLFVQLHHPARSELWVPGNHPWAVMVDDRLDAWANDCGRAAVTFFGHTHAWSRGQSRDAAHLMINVASAGGALDRWGEQNQRNEPMFTVSDDTWGWTLVEVSAGDDPTLTVRRFSLGDRDATADNAEIDALSVRAYAAAPAQPAAIAPAGDDVPSDCVTLAAGPFSDPDGEAHQATWWQVAPDCTFSQLLAESWRQDHDLYFGADGQAGDDLTDEVLTTLPEGPACWRVRYRDASLAWSDWSDPVAFTLAPRQRSLELLEDGGAERPGFPGWDRARAAEIAGDGRCGAVPPHGGSQSYGLAGPCSPGPGRMVREVTLPPVLPGRTAHLSGWLHDAGGPGVRLRLTWTDAAGDPLGATAWLDPDAPDWTEVRLTAALPDDAVQLHLELEADTTGYVDDLSLTVGTDATVDCAPRVATAAPPADDPACGCDHRPSGAAGVWLLVAWASRRRRPALR
jgi:hypothetical protein